MLRETGVLDKLYNKWIGGVSRYICDHAEEFTEAIGFNTVVAPFFFLCGTVIASFVLLILEKGFKFLNKK